ncbi:hypothetical protein [Streptomyces sp. NPDC127039]|uniref:hypothetical protein n=1 Tax=Streptomyces sp. NPDC127039 TaxID=3347115 RepID=UPI003656ACA3
MAEKVSSKILSALSAASCRFIFGGPSVLEDGEPVIPHPESSSASNEIDARVLLIVASPLS